MIKGKEIGRKLGFPTANIILPEKMASGIYGGTAYSDGKSYKSAIFVDKSGMLLEAHLLNFSGDLYGKKIEVEVSKKIREVMNFENSSELTGQIKKDIEIVKNL